MKSYSEIGHPIDARLAAWISSASPCAAGRYLYSDASMPEPEEKPSGRGFDWQDRAAAAVLRECYRRALLDPMLERVEAAALAVLPEPDDDEDDQPAFFFRLVSPRERWEQTVSATAVRVSGILRHGPTASISGGEAVFAGGELETEVSGMRLRQRIDLLWRHADGGLEVILVAGEPNDGKPPAPAREDWRCILAAAIVSSLHGVSPLVHLVRVSASVAQAVRFPTGELEQRISELSQAVAEAEDPKGCGDAFAYPLSPEATEPLRRGEWPRVRRLPPGLPG